MNQSRVVITPSARARPWVMALAALIWITLFLRLGLVVEELWRAGDPLFWALGRFGYFTVLTTLLAALSVTAGLFSRRDAVIGSLASVSFAGLVATSLVMVALVYTLVLRAQWDPHGLHKVVDSLLHDVIPLAFLLYWWWLVPKSALRYRMVLYWLCYPAFYLLVVMVLGLAIGWYPYPFLDVPELGPLRVRFNVVALLGLFAALGAGLIAVSRRWGR
ncbi:Pr6Pr family membrane protein [Marinimicrobium sp. C2-29]|uniref:Pr6Pr family membrane protein n=1 Tax=Marinimicrobium sp. C2-29 TaxID=3139825 RepID=UPI00313A3443